VIDTDRHPDRAVVELAGQDAPHISVKDAPQSISHLVPTGPTAWSSNAAGARATTRLLTDDDGGGGAVGPALAPTTWCGMPLSPGAGSDDRACRR
jgi:hypothetical protein